MEERNRRWTLRKQKEPQLKLSKLGGAVEMITSEKIECRLHVPHQLLMHLR